MEGSLAAGEELGTFILAFDRPKPTVGCSASGRRRRRISVGQIKNVSRINVDTPYFVSNIHILQTPMRSEMSMQR
jgi:hypothetical protein